MHFLAGHDKELVFYFKGKRKSRGFYVNQSHNLIYTFTGYLGCCLDYRGQQWKEGSSWYAIMITQAKKTGACNGSTRGDKERVRDMGRF